MQVKTYLPMTYSIDNNYKSEKFIKLRMRVCHDGRNPNGSSFKLADLISRKDSLCESPILAHIYDNEEGIPELGEHDFLIEQNKLDNSKQKKIYLEQPVGVIPKEYNFEVTEDDGAHYINVDGYIWKEYSNYCEDLISMNDEFKISMEVDILNYSYDSKSDCYNINDFIFKAVTLLNDKYDTGMNNARANVETFSSDNQKNINLFMLMKQELSEELSKNNEKGECVMDIEKILAEYGLTREDLDFEIDDSISEEEFRKKCKKLSKCSAETDPSEEDSESSDSANSDKAGESENTEGVTKEPDDSKDTKLKIELSCDEKSKKIYQNLDYMERDVWIIDLYDSYFIYKDYDNGKCLKQSYSIDEYGNITLGEESVEVFLEYLTADERTQVAEMRSNYAKLQNEVNELKAYKTNVELQTRNQAVEEVFKKFELELSDNAEFHKLKSDNSKFSVDEVEEKCYSILGRKTAKFSSSKKSPSIRFPIDVHNSSENNSPYGGLFEKYHK